MIVLALDCCGPLCAVGVWNDGALLALEHEHMERGQDGRLMPMVTSVMKTSALSYAQLDRVAVTRGPGSFTGVRVALAAARGIGLASSKPVIGVSRFDIYRALYVDVSNLLVVLNSKRAELFCTFYSASQAAEDPCLMTVQEIELFLKSHPATLVRGDLADQTPSEIDLLAMCAALASAATLDDPRTQATPLYLREPDVSFAKVR